MLELVKNDGISYGNIKPLEWNSVVDKYKLGIDRLNDYVKNIDSKVVPNEHHLVKIIKFMDVDPRYDKTKYYFKVKRLLDDTLRHMDIVNSLSLGNIIYDILPNDTSLIVSFDSGYDLIKNEDVFKLRSFKLKRTDINSLDIMHPYRMDFTGSINIYYLDIVLMMMQYREYYQYCINNDITPSIHSFVYKYTLFELLTDIIDLSIFKNLFNNVTDTELKLTMYSVNNYYINSSIKKLKENINKQVCVINCVLYNTLSIVKENSFYLLEYENTFLTNNNIFIIIYSIIDKLKLIIDNLNSRSIRKNNAYFDKLYREIKYLKSQSKLSRYDIVGDIIKMEILEFKNYMKDIR